MHRLDDERVDLFQCVSFAKRTKKKERQCSLHSSWDGMEWDEIRVVPEPVPIAGREEHRYAI